MKPDRKNDFDRKYAKLVAKAWADESFRTRFLNEPGSVFAEYDMDMPEGMEVRIVEDSDQVQHFVLPRRPVTASFSERQFDGGEHGCGGCGGCFGCGGCRGGD